MAQQWTGVFEPILYNTFHFQKSINYPDCLLKFTYKMRKTAQCGGLACGRYGYCFRRSGINNSRFLAGHGNRCFLLYLVWKKRRKESGKERERESSCNKFVGGNCFCPTVCYCFALYLPIPSTIGENGSFRQINVYSFTAIEWHQIISKYI